MLLSATREGNMGATTLRRIVRSGRRAHLPCRLSRCLLPAILAAAACCLAAGCDLLFYGGGPNGERLERPRAEDEDLFAKIRLGMTRAEVECVLDATDVRWRYRSRENLLFAFTPMRRVNPFLLSAVHFEIRFDSRNAVASVEKRRDLTGP